MGVDFMHANYSDNNFQLKLVSKDAEIKIKEERKDESPNNSEESLL